MWKDNKHFLWGMTIKKKEITINGLRDIKKEEKNKLMELPAMAVITIQPELIKRSIRSNECRK